MWTGGTGAKLVGMALMQLGLRIQLGHTPPDFCPAPVADDGFIIIDTHGVHEVSLSYCGCNAARSRRSQLADARLYSAAHSNPKSAIAYETAYTFNVLQPPVSMRRSRN